MTYLLSTVFLAVALPALPPAPIGDVFPGDSQSPDPIIFEFTDYGGTNSAARAKVTQETAEAWCGNWRNLSGNAQKACGREIVGGTEGKIYEAHANCQTGDLWSQGKHYVFDGPEEQNQMFYGYAGVKDVETGKRVAMTDADGGRELGAQWLTLCPMGWPYDVQPVEKTFTLKADQSQYGEFMGHNGSLVFFHQKQHVIVYSEPKRAIADTVRPDAVLARGWSVPNEWFSGIAYTFKKSCEPAPYFVTGRMDGGLHITLRGKAPIRQGCDVVGYSDKSPNAKLVFDLSSE